MFCNSSIKGDIVEICTKWTCHFVVWLELKPKEVHLLEKVLVLENVTKQNVEHQQEKVLEKEQEAEGDN